MPHYSALPIHEDEERASLRALVRDVVSTTAPPARIGELDELEEFDERLYAALADSGLIALEADAAGSPASHVSQTIVLEELGATATSMAVCLVVQYMGVTLLAEHGSPQQRDDVLVPILSGQQRVAFALTEPGGGTDVARAMATRARREADGTWRLNGAKLWISGADDAGTLIVLARTADPQPGRSAVSGITMFLVPAGSPGVTTNILDTIGIHGLSTCEVAFEEVLLPPDAVLGAEGMGFRQVLATLNGERLNAAAVALGIARGAQEASLTFVREREAFGRQIGGFQVLQHRLVDGAIGIEMVRGLVQRAANTADEGGEAEVLTAMAKVAAAETAVDITERGMRSMGGAGLSREYSMQRFFRDARLYTFAPLTDEMTKNFIGEHYLALPRSY